MAWSSLPEYPPEAPNIHNIDRLVAEHGTEWMAGYLKALEIVAVDLADILLKREDNPCGFEETPHMVRTNLKKYWTHNKTLYLTLIPRIASKETLQSKSEPK